MPILLVKDLKKLMKIGIPILLTVIMLSPTMVTADFNATVGNTFTYEVVKSEWDVTRGTNSSTGKGFSYEEKKYDGTGNRAHPQDEYRRHQ